MKLRVVGHSFRNSGSPYLVPDSGHCILKRWRGLGSISCPIRESLEIAIFDEPTPNKGVNGIPDGGHFFQPDSHPRLWQFDTQKLFPIAERGLNAPPVAIPSDQRACLQNLDNFFVG